MARPRPLTVGSCDPTTTDSILDAEARALLRAQAEEDESRDAIEALLAAIRSHVSQLVLSAEGGEEQAVEAELQALESYARALHAWDLVACTEEASRGDGADALQPGDLAEIEAAWGAVEREVLAALCGQGEG